jgi:predicted phage tail protein
MTPYHFLGNPFPVVETTDNLRQRSILRSTGKTRNREITELLFQEGMMTVQQSLRAVGTFASRREAEAALHQLRDSNFPMDRVSVLAKDTDRNEQVGGVQVNDRNGEEAREGAGVGAVTGTALGGVTGLLIGLEALIIPGVGPFLAAGTLATTLAGAGIGAAAGGLIGALAPKEIT